jgi:hypothetical protein
MGFSFSTLYPTIKFLRPLSTNFLPFDHDLTRIQPYDLR